MTDFNASRIKCFIRLVLLSSVFLIPLNAMAAEPIRTAPLENLAFDSEIEAVEAMKDHCLAESSREDAEHVGAILQTDEGRFLVTHGQAESGQTKVTFAILRPPSAKVVALWHMPHGVDLPERVGVLADRVESYYESGENPKQRVL